MDIMKLNAILLLSLMITFGNLLFAQSSSKIEFEKLSHDFGTIKEDDGVVSYSFRFKNTGDAPLIINNVKASCGCTTPEWTHKPLIPGSEGLIKVNFNPRRRPGNFTKTISVYSNAGNSVVTLKITGNVIAHVKTSEEIYKRKLGLINLKTNHLSFVKMKENEIKTDTVEFINFENTPVEIGIKKSPVYTKVKILPEKVMPNQEGSIIVTWDASKDNIYGFKMDRIYFTFNGEGSYNYSLGISATIEEDFSQLSEEEIANAPSVSVNSKVFDFGEINEGEKVNHVFSVKNEGNRDLIIRRVKASCGCTAATPDKNVIKKGEDTEIKVVFNSKGKRGRQNKSITLITNDPKQPTTILRVTGNVKTSS